MRNSHAILHRSRSPRKKRRGPSDEFDVSRPTPLPSIVPYRLKNYWKRRQVSVTIVGRIESKLTRAQSAMGTSVCVTLRQPMTTTSCEWIHTRENLRGVKAESRDNDCSYHRRRSGPLGGTMHITTHRASGMR